MTHVTVLHNAVPRGASPDEKDVLVQVAEVEAALARSGFSTSRLSAGLDLGALRRRLLARAPGLVFNLVESVGGHGSLIHLVPALLDALGLPYTGARSEGMFASSSKLLAKRLLAAHGVPTPAWCQDGARAARSGGSWIVKSVWEDASIGLEDACVVNGRAVAEALGERSRRFGGEWFAERFIEGREFNVALLARGGEVECLPMAEMCFVDYPAEKPHIVNYAAKWHPQSFEYSHTVRRFDLPAADAALLERIEAVARRCWGLLDMRGYARVDVRVDGGGRPWVLEVNANPCLSSDAGFAAALERAGIGFDTAVRRIVEAAGYRDAIEPRRARAATAALQPLGIPPAG